MAWSIWEWANNQTRLERFWQNFYEFVNKIDLGYNVSDSYMKMREDCVFVLCCIYFFRDSWCGARHHARKHQKYISRTIKIMFTIFLPFLLHLKWLCDMWTSIYDRLCDGNICACTSDDALSLMRLLRRKITSTQI